MDQREYDEMISRGYDPGLLGPRPSADSPPSETSSETDSTTRSGSPALKIGLAVIVALVIGAVSIAAISKGGEAAPVEAESERSSEIEDMMAGIRQSNTELHRRMDDWDTYESTRQRYEPGSGGSYSGGSSGSGDVAAPKSGGGGPSSTAIRAESPIYHNSTNWGWLAEAGYVRPGVKLESQDGACSAGFMVHAGGSDYILTAGHCGDVGSEWYVPAENGTHLFVGTMVESTFDHVGGSDYGLISLGGSEARWTSETPLGMPLVGWGSPEWARQSQAQICRLGYRTGLACGDYIGDLSGESFAYRTITDRGDSGGPIFGVLDGELYALGVSSGYGDSDATRATAQRVDLPVNRHSLTMYSG